MKTQTPLLLAFLFFGVSSSAAAQKSLEASNIENDPTWESWVDNPDASSAFKCGLVTDYDREVEVSKKFYVLLPKSNYSYLCVEVRSRDARYYAHMEVPVYGLTGIQEIDWPTDHYKKMKKFGTQDITIIASLSQSCDSDYNNYVLASWNEEGITKPDYVYAILHAESSAVVQISDKDNNILEKISCIFLEDTSNTAYDCYCKIPISAIREKHDIKLLHVNSPSDKVPYNSFPLKIQPWKGIE